MANRHAHRTPLPPAVDVDAWPVPDDQDDPTPDEVDAATRTEDTRARAWREKAADPDTVWHGDAMPFLWR